MSGPVGIRTRARGSGGPYSVQAILRAQLMILNKLRMGREGFAGVRWTPAILSLQMRGRRPNEVLSSQFLNSVYPQHPQATRSLWVAMKTPGPHLGQTGLVLLTLSPSTLYASFLQIDPFLTGAFAIRITPELPLRRAPQAWGPRCRSS